VIVLVAGVVLGAVGGCTGNGGRSDDSVVVVSVDYMFGSLNAATPAGRSPGSTLVRGLVHEGFFTTDMRGRVVPNLSFGTVEKTSDAPLTVRYTVAQDVVWSDGVPVTGADLLLEWAARSGQLDEIVPVVGGDGTVPVPPDADQSVAFWAASPALVHVQAIPTVDERTLTLVYSTPVADWMTALDVNVPAHVVGRLALGSPGGTTPPAATTAAGWAGVVSSAITSVDRDVLVPISRQWRAYGVRAALAADPARGVTTGPYRISHVSDDRTELVVNEHYTGDRRGTVPTVVVRSDLDPLAQVRAVRSGSVDVALPMSTIDVRTAAGESSLTIATGGGAALQLWLGEQPTSPFAGASGAAMRSAFVATLDPPGLARAVNAPACDVVLAQAGPDWKPPEPPDDADADDPGDAPDEQTDEPADDPGQEPHQAEQDEAPAADEPTPVSPTSRVAVRLLVDTHDPERAALAQTITDQAARAGFDITLVTSDITVALWSQPGRWDVALVPVVQDPLPVSAVVARWRTGGAGNVTAHSDEVLDALLDALVSQTGEAAIGAGLANVADALTASHVVVPLVRQPEIAVQSRGRLAKVHPPSWGASDLTAWWNWLP